MQNFTKYSKNGDNLLKISNPVFFFENKKHIISWPSAEFARSVLSVNQSKWFCKLWVLTLSSLGRILKYFSYFS